MEKPKRPERSKRNRELYGSIDRKIQGGKNHQLRMPNKLTEPPTLFEVSSEEK
jgi:hypothetical protein